MPKVEVTYPVLAFNRIKLNLTEEEYERIKAMPMEEQATWIVEQDKKLKKPNDLDETSIYHALDVDYATIKAIR
jgi:hypothetical protein